MKKPTNLTLGEKLKANALHYCEEREISLSQLVQDLLQEHLNQHETTSQKTSSKKYPKASRSKNSTRKS